MVVFHYDLMTPKRPRLDITAIAPLGGSGPRLYPLTIETPKHLTPICNRAIFDAAIDHYIEQGVRSVILGATGFENRVRSYQFFGHGRRYSSRISDDVNVFYTRYDDREFLKRGSGDVFLYGLREYKEIMNGNHLLLVNGDNLSDNNLPEFYQAHLDRKAMLTILVKGLDEKDPRLADFGTVLFDDETLRVTGFAEKAPVPVSRYVNTGICLFSPEIHDLLQDPKMVAALEERRTNGRLDVGGHLIPALVDNGMPVYVSILNNSWSDVGTPHSYRETTRDILQGKYPEIKYNNYNRVGNALVHETTQALMGDRLKKVKFEGRCIVGYGVEIGEGTVVRDSVIGANVHIGKGAVIDHSTTLFPFAKLEDGVHIVNGIVGYDTILRKHCNVNSGAVIGDYLEIPQRRVIGVDWRVAANRHSARILDARINGKPMYEVIDNIDDADAVVFKPRSAA